MSIQTDKYKAFKTNNESVLRRLADKYGYNKLPKNIKNIKLYAHRLGNFIEKLQYENYDNPLKVNTKPTGNYKKFLDISGLHDTTQSKQVFKDIEDFTKLAKNVKSHMGEIGRALDTSDRIELNNLVTGKTSVKEYLKNTPKAMLKFSPYEKTESIKNLGDESYLNEVIKRKSLGLTEKQYNKLIKKFNSLSFHKRIQFNQTLNREYFLKYEESKMRGLEFNSYETLNNLIKEYK